MEWNVQCSAMLLIVEQDHFSHRPALPFKSCARQVSPRLCCLSFRIYTIGTMGDPLHVAVERIK